MNFLNDIVIPSFLGLILAICFSEIAEAGHPDQKNVHTYLMFTQKDFNGTLNVQCTFNAEQLDGNTVFIIDHHTHDKNLCVQGNNPLKEFKYSYLIKSYNRFDAYSYTFVMLKTFKLTAPPSAGVIKW